MTRSKKRRLRRAKLAYHCENCPKETQNDQSALAVGAPRAYTGPRQASIDFPAKAAQEEFPNANVRA